MNELRRKPKSRKNKIVGQERINMLKHFKRSPDSTLYNQNMVAVVRNRCPALIERDRCYGKGVPYIKTRHRIFYLKKDILEWIEKQDQEKTGIKQDD